VRQGEGFSNLMNRRGFLGKLTRATLVLGALRFLAAEILSVKAAAIPRHGSAFSAAFSEEFH